jgi:hypothetical protein
LRLLHGSLGPLLTSRLIVCPVLLLLCLLLLLVLLLLLLLWRRQLLWRLGLLLLRLPLTGLLPILRLALRLVRWPGLRVIQRPLPADGDVLLLKLGSKPHS